MGANRLFKKNDIGIDLGTSNIMVAIKGKGIVLNEPSVVAIKNTTNMEIAIGAEAKEMIGRTPENISAIKPLQGGVIADFIATRILLNKIMSKVYRRHKVKKPRVIVGVPCGITEVEERAVEEVVLQAGAREVYLIEEPMAAAIGAGIKVAEPTGNIVVDIGGGTTEVAVISLGGIVLSNSIRIAGDNLDEDIVSYIKKRYNMIIGVKTAEEIKIELGCATPVMSERTLEITGRDLENGLPKSIVISSEEIRVAIENSLEKIIEAIKLTLEKTPPELSADLMAQGIVLTGGGALIENFDQLISQKTGIPVRISETPLEDVVNGTQKALSDLEKLRNSLKNKKRK